MAIKDMNSASKAYRCVNVQLKFSHAIGDQLFGLCVVDDLERRILSHESCRVDQSKQSELEETAEDQSGLVPLNAFGEVVVIRRLGRLD